MNEWEVSKNRSQRTLYILAHTHRQTNTYPTPRGNISCSRSPRVWPGSLSETGTRPFFIFPLPLGRLFQPKQTSSCQQMPADYQAHHFIRRAKTSESGSSPTRHKSWHNKKNLSPIFIPVKCFSGICFYFKCQLLPIYHFPFLFY